jgi:hypothetical protein
MITQKKYPYANTTADPEHTMTQINKLLQKYGIPDYQWTTEWSKNRVSLRFVLEEQNGKKLMLLFRPPAFLASHRNWNATKGRNEITEAPNWAASLRFLYYRLKTKLETVAYGALEAEQEFMQNIIVHDAQGRETTLGEAMKPIISKGLETEGSIDISKALPAHSEMRDADVVDISNDTKT